MGSCDANNQYNAIRGEISALISQTGRFLADLTASPSELLGQQLNHSFLAFRTAKQKHESETIDCALMALTKSGKSTLINAFCGAKLMPSNNVPETARITSVEHQTSGLPTLQYKMRDEFVRVEGEDNIYDYLQFLNGEVRGRAHRKEDEEMLTVKVEIAALQGGGDGGEEQQVRLRLLDTPGTNEAGEDRLRHSVERLLDSVDAVVFLMDYGKLKTSEEATMLAKLKEKNPQLVNRLAQRLFFVVNKIDCIHSSTGQEENELREYVADLITSQMNSESFHLRPEQVMLVSAQEALLARLVLLGKASEDDKRKFAHKVWGSSFARSRRSKSPAEYQEQAAAMLEDSRLPELEENLLSYLYRNAGALKLVSQVDTITQLLLEVQNVAMTGKAALQQSASQLVRESRELQRRLQSTQDRFAEVQHDADLMEATVIDDVQFKMQGLKERLFEHVAEVLDGVEQPRLPAVKTGPWRKIWEKSVKFITRSGGDGPSHSDNHLRELLQDLHQDINAQIEAEVQEFWHSLEISTNEKHKQLVHIINGHLDRLARDIEDVVGKSLDLKLEPVVIHMDPPSAQEFHNSLQDLFNAGIGKSTRIHKEMNEEEYVVWERKFRGLCKQSEYYVGRPAKKQVEIEKQVTTYQFQPEKIKEYFTNTVSSTIDTSIKYVRSYVHAYLMDNIDEARLKISSYGERFAETIQAALNTKSQSEEQQQAGLEALEGHLHQVSTLLHTAALIQHSASSLSPAATCPPPLQEEGAAREEVPSAPAEPTRIREQPLPLELFSQPQSERNQAPTESGTPPTVQAQPSSSEGHALVEQGNPFTEPGHPSASRGVPSTGQLYPTIATDADRDMLEVFLNLNRLVDAGEGRQTTHPTKDPSPTPTEEAAPAPSPPAQSDPSPPKPTMPTLVDDGSEEKSLEGTGAAVEEVEGYICPGPVDHRPEETAPATPAESLSPPGVNPFNFLLEGSAGTGSQAGGVEERAAPSVTPVHSTPSLTEVAAVGPSSSLGPHSAEGSEHSLEVPLPLSARRTSMDSREVYSASSIASASASPMHSSAVLPAEAQKHAAEVSRPASLASASVESEWECVDSEDHASVA